MLIRPNPLLVFSVSLLVAGCVVLPEAPSSTGQDAGPIADAVSLETAEEDYLTYCAICHAADGSGYTADNANALSHPAFLATATDELLRTSIVRGRPGTPMSAWGEALGGPLSDARVEGLVAYMRSWQVGGSLELLDLAVEGEVARGKPQYAARCAECHGPAGEGGEFMSLNNPEFLAVASDGYIREAIASGRSGTAMAAYLDVLPQQTIDDLVVLIRSWQTPVDDTPFEAPDVDIGNATIHLGGVKPTFEEGLYLPADDLKAQLDMAAEVIIIDARTPKDYTTGHITGSISIPFYAVAEVADQLPPDVAVVTYCGCPHAESTIAAQALIDAGRTDVKVLDEGYYVWTERGYAISTGPSPGVWALPSP
jgi:cytochrome c oxidase cbb3-type subunit III